MHCDVVRRFWGELSGAHLGRCFLLWLAVVVGQRLGLLWLAAVVVGQRHGLLWLAAVGWRLAP